MRSVPHLEGILLAIDVGIEVSEWIGSIGTELCLAGVTNPGRDVVPTEVVAVVAVHENSTQVLILETRVCGLILVGAVDSFRTCQISLWLASQRLTMKGPLDQAKHSIS